MEMKQIRMGIVGAGTWGETHASIYAEHLFADPVAICDMNEERARAIADKYGTVSYTHLDVYKRQNLALIGVELRLLFAQLHLIQPCLGGDVVLIERVNYL